MWPKEALSAGSPVIAVAMGVHLCLKATRIGNDVVKFYRKQVYRKYKIERCVFTIFIFFSLNKSNAINILPEYVTGSAEKGDEKKS